MALRHPRFAAADLAAFQAHNQKAAARLALRALVWTCAALAILREAENDLGASSPLAAPFRLAQRELNRKAVRPPRDL